jgi:UDP-hydrolysing UDP-N-acetyl-D-glucosamine 2-epimerase
LKRGTLLSRRALEESIGARLGSRNLLITFHPVTLEPDRGAGQAKGMLEALRGLDPSIQLWFTLPNADTGGAAIKTLVEDFAADNVERARVFTSLGHSRYLSLMSQVDAVVGNSSSGLYEAPSFGIATVDIGTRQKGRLAGDSVVHCDGTRASVAAALERALNLDCKGAVNPYGDGDASRRIVRQLVSLDFHGLINKSFHPFDSNKS